MRSVQLNTPRWRPIPPAASVRASATVNVTGEVADAAPSSRVNCPGLIFSASCTTMFVFPREDTEALSFSWKPFSDSEALGSGLFGALASGEFAAASCWRAGRNLDHDGMAAVGDW